MSESRLFQIIYYLLRKGRVTAPELAAEFEVSVRTIYRDIDALSASGIPVYSSRGRGGGIALLDGFVFDRTLISKEEQHTILSSLQSLSALLPDTEKELLSKLGGVFRQESSDWIEADMSPWGTHSGKKEMFRQLRAAILQKHPVTFRYRNTSGQTAMRQVKPVKICYKSNAWYLQAFCLTNQAFRTFKLNRMYGVEIMPEQFTESLLPPPIDMAEDSILPDPILLRFDQVSAYRVYEEFDEADICELEDGSLSVKCHFPADNWLYGYLMSFCGTVDILEPELIRLQFSETVKRMYEKYKK